MRVLKLSPDPAYRLLYPSDAVHRPGLWEFHGEPLADRLMGFEAHFDSSKDAPEPDIAYLGMTTFAFRKDVADTLCELLEPWGELLTCHVGDQLWYALNVTTKCDALDEANSEFAINTGTIKLHLCRYAFHKDKLPPCALFKIPQDRYSAIFLADSQQADDEVLSNLFCAVQAYGYRGLLFEEVG